MRSPPRLTGLATDLQKIAGYAQGCDDGKNLIEDSFCGNESRQFMAANPVAFRDAEAFKAVS